MSTEFEKFAKSIGYCNFEKYKGKDRYKHNRLQGDYRVWKAAAESLQTQLKQEQEAHDVTRERVRELEKVAEKAAHVFIDIINDYEMSTDMLMEIGGDEDDLKQAQTMFLYGRVVWGELNKLTKQEKG